MVAPDEAVKDTLAELLDSDLAETPVGAVGIVIGVVILADAVDDGEVPPEFVAVTVNV